MANLETSIFSVLLVASLAGFASLFLIDGNTFCPSNTRCVCNEYFIQCRDSNLTEFPNFTTQIHLGIIGSYTIDLDGNSIQSIPANWSLNLVPGPYTNVEIYIRDNNVSSICADAFFGMAELVTYLDLSGNVLESIPAEINELVNIVTLILDKNDISAVKETDLDQLSLLVDLSLIENPIEYIADNAFTNNTRLETLDLWFTRIVTLPASLTGLSNLIDLNIDHTLLVCDCNLSSLIGWDVSGVTLDGYCDHNGLKTVKSYLMNELAACP